MVTDTPDDVGAADTLQGLRKMARYINLGIAKSARGNISRQATERVRSIMRRMNMKKEIIKEFIKRFIRAFVIGMMVIDVAEAIRRFEE